MITSEQREEAAKEYEKDPLDKYLAVALRDCKDPECPTCEVLVDMSTP